MLSCLHSQNANYFGVFPLSSSSKFCQTMRMYFRNAFSSHPNIHSCCNLAYVFKIIRLVDAFLYALLCCYYGCYQLIFSHSYNHVMMMMMMVVQFEVRHKSTVSFLWPFMLHQHQQRGEISVELV